MMLPRKGGSTTLSVTGRVPGSGAVIVQVYASEGSNARQFAGECQAVVEAF